MNDSYIEFEIKERLEEITSQLSHLILDIISVSLRSIDNSICINNLLNPKMPPKKEPDF